MPLRPGERPSRVQLSVLDRLLDADPERVLDQPLGAAETLAALRRAARRDLEALLNARQRWRSWPVQLTELAVSPLNYGVPDFTSGYFASEERREGFRRAVEAAIAAFEPRLKAVKVSLVPGVDETDRTLRLRVEALMLADPEPEPVSFDTAFDSASMAFVVQGADAV
ncbi:type VI secretion system baseplate subunit TssE [Elioraea rosea]|uniref:type VI secretion system baseplate subunit TssE n=1 Tax=Elioraea rosea TaxID=2492390 RepID=UPI0011861BED|nr:type VI secretion system baseplate subunit TssE [Elioraea rosea]